MFISIGSKQNIARCDQLLENEGLQASRNPSLGVCFPSQTDLSDVTLPEDLFFQIAYTPRLPPRPKMGFFTGFLSLHFSSPRFTSSRFSSIRVLLNVIHGPALQ